MGTIRFNSQRGRWMLDYKDAGGRRLRECIGPKTNREDRAMRRLAKQVLKQREGDAAAGRYSPSASRMPSPLFRDFARRWLDRNRTQGNIVENTYNTYHAALEMRLIPFLGDKPLDAITKADVEAFKDECIEAGRVQRSTINHSLQVLKTVLNAADAEDLVPKSPARGVKKLRVEKVIEETRALNLQQVARLLVAATYPWRTLFAFALETGMRRNEILGLQWRDLDLDADPPMVYIRAQLGRRGHRVNLKTTSSEADLEISPELVAALRALPRGDDPDRDFVFLSRRGNPIDTSSLYAAWKATLTLAGLPHVTFHSLRHTCGSLLHDQGVDLKVIQAHLRHSSITMTADTYTHKIRPERYRVAPLLAGIIHGARPDLATPMATKLREHANPASIAAR